MCALRVHTTRFIPYGVNTKRDAGCFVPASRVGCLISLAFLQLTSSKDKSLNGKSLKKTASMLPDFVAAVTIPYRL